tara:strand:+ start:403 stop:1173 length:771 start_codon:yes stop_codon:yes gene_type:complete
MFIKKKIIENVGIITINRESALNALNYKVLKELKENVVLLIDDSRVHSIILTGAGEKAFIAGADIKFMENLNKKTALEFGKLGHEVASILENSSKPTIAAINGFALGGGCEISLACHFRYASENAKFSQPEVKLGLIPGMGGTQRLSKIVGRGIALELIIGGQMIDAHEALRIGLVNKIFSKDSLMEETIKFSQFISSNSPRAIEKSIYCINQSYENTLSSGLLEEVNVFSNLFETRETSEGLKAFVEKRKPDFRL